MFGWNKNQRTIHTCILSPDKLPEDIETPHVEWIHMNRTGLNNNDMAITCVARGVPPPEIWFYRGDSRQGTELITVTNKRLPQTLSHSIHIIRWIQNSGEPADTCWV